MWTRSKVASTTFHAWVRDRPCRAQRTSSRPTAHTCPVRSASSTSAAPKATTASSRCASRSRARQRLSFTVRPSAADLGGRPPPGPVGHREARHRDRRVLTGPRDHRTGRCRAAPAVLVPHQWGRTPEARQVHQLHDRAVLHPRRHPAPATSRPVDGLLDMLPGRLGRLIIDGEAVTSGRPTSSAHMRVALTGRGRRRIRLGSSSPGSR